MILLVLKIDYIWSFGAQNNEYSRRKIILIDFGILKLYHNYMLTIVIISSHISCCSQFMTALGGSKGVVTLRLRFRLGARFLARSAFETPYINRRTLLLQKALCYDCKVAGATRHLSPSCDSAWHQG